MQHWKKTWYSLLRPLMIWVVFIIAVPFLGMVVIVSLAVLTPLGDTIVKTLAMFCALILAPLAAVFEIAPPFVTRREVRWRNRNSERFERDVVWEDVPFLQPVLNRIRSTTGKRKPREEKESEPASDTKPSTA